MFRPDNCLAEIFKFTDLVGQSLNKRHFRERAFVLAVYLLSNFLRRDVKVLKGHGPF